MSALLPCPFCGGTEGRFTTDSGNPTAYTGKWGWWECSCGARAEDVRTGYDADGWQSAAIAAWNRRATPAEVDTEARSLALNLKTANRLNAEKDAELATLRARVERLEGVFGAWIEAEDALREFERLNPNNSGRAWRQLFDARAGAEDAASAALEDRT